MSATTTLNSIDNISLSTLTDNINFENKNINNNIMSTDDIIENDFLNINLQNNL